MIPGVTLRDLTCAHVGVSLYMNVCLYCVRTCACVHVCAYVCICECMNIYDLCMGVYMYLQLKLWVVRGIVGLNLGSKLLCVCVYV